MSDHQKLVGPIALFKIGEFLQRTLDAAHRFRVIVGHHRLGAHVKVHYQQFRELYIGNQDLPDLLPEIYENDADPVEKIALSLVENVPMEVTCFGELAEVIEVCDCVLAIKRSLLGLSLQRVKPAYVHEQR